MTSNRPKHIEPSSTDPTDGDTTKARALETSRVEQSEPAIMKPTALSIDPASHHASPHTDLRSAL